MLINYSQLNQERQEYRAASHEVKARKFITEELDQEIGVTIGTLTPNVVIHVANNSRWSLHDLTVHCLKQSGPAAIHFCTYAIKEYQARLLTTMLADGLITELHALVDYRFKKLDPQAEQLIANAANTYRSEERLHGKVTVIRNQEWGIAIVGSANYTTNTSRDTIVIDTCTEIADYWIQWIQKNINNA